MATCVITDTICKRLSLRISFCSKEPSILFPPRYTCRQLIAEAAINLLTFSFKMPKAKLSTTGAESSVAPLVEGPLVADE